MAILSDRSVSFGVGQRPEVRAALRAREAGLPVVRRSSGGTGLLHLPGDIAWSVVLPRTHPSAGRDYPKSYGRLGAPLVPVLAEAGVPAGWRPSPGLSDEYCLLGRRGETLYAGEAALGGAAQHVTAAALLHHGVVSVRVDRALLGEIFQLDAATAGRLTGLEELRARGTPEEVARRLARALRGALDHPASPGDR